MPAGSDRHLTLLVPGLFGPRPPDATGPAEAARVLTEGLELPVLETLLSRARRGAAPWRDETLEGMLFRCFGIERPDPGQDWPVAAITRALDAGAADSGWLLRADPVHLHADVDNLRLFEGRSFPLYRAEAEALAGELNAALAGEEWRLEVLHARRWYLRLAGAPGVRTHSPSEVSAGRLEAFLPEGERAAHWRRVLNEMQMVLHASPVNREREARGERPVNALWLWGGGRLPAAPAPRWEQVWSDDPLALGLARLARAGHADLPGGAAAWLQAGPLPGRHLLVFDAVHRLSRLADVEGWQRFLLGFERDWLAPLHAALRRGELGSLTLLGGGATQYRVGRRDLWRWWRRRGFARHVAREARAARRGDTP